MFLLYRPALLWNLTSKHSSENNVDIQNDKKLSWILPRAHWAGPYWRRWAWRCRHFLFSAGRRLQSHPWPRSRPPRHREARRFSVALVRRQVCFDELHDDETHHDSSGNQRDARFLFAPLGFVVGGQSCGDAVGRGVGEASSVFLVFKESCEGLKEVRREVRRAPQNKPSAQWDHKNS